MIVLLSPGLGQAQAAAVLARAAELGLELVPLDAGKGRAFEVVGPRRGEALGLRGVPGVAEILTRRTALTGGEPLWPHLALRVGALTLGLLGLLVLLAAFFPPGLGEAAGGEPAVGAPVEWFLRLPALLVGFDSLGAAFLAPLFWLLLAAWPFLDRLDPQSAAGKALCAGRWLVAVGLLLTVAWLAWGGAA